MRSLIVFLLLSSYAMAQPWSGIINSARAIDWRNAGLTGTFPDSETPVNAFTPPARNTVCSTLHMSDFSGMTFTITFSNGSAVIGGTQTLVAGQTVAFTTTGTLPTNFSPSTTYWVLAAGLSGSQFEVSATPNGAAITAGSAGSGTHTSSGIPVASTPLNTAIQNCPNGQVVALKAGNYYFNSTFYTNGACRDQYTLRGDGADQTKIYIMGNFLPQMTCTNSTSGKITWSAGFTQGTTSITLASDPGSNKILVLEQCNTGWSGATCSTPISATSQNVDNGFEWVCFEDPILCAHSGPSYPQHGQSQIQIVKTGTTSSCGAGCFTVPITPGLYMDNWNNANSPYATTATTRWGVGWEDMLIDLTGTTNANGLSMIDCYSCWLKGNEIIVAQGHTLPSNPLVGLNTSVHSLIMNNYIVYAYSAYHLSRSTFGDNLVLNNIISDGSALMATDQGGEGDVTAYNYSNSIQKLSSSADYFEHVPGTAFNLNEGNEIYAILYDNNHGGHLFETSFRNRLSAANTGVAASIFPYQIGQGSRGVNVIGNVLGSSNVVNYVCGIGPGNCPAGNSIYYLGLGLQGSGFMNDGIAGNSLFRWGNYDSVNGVVRFVSGEVPSGLNAAIGFTQAMTPATGDGVNKTFTTTLPNTPIVPGNTVVFDFTVGIGFAAYDDATAGTTGNFIGNVSAGTINRTTGAVTVTFTNAPANGDSVQINYLQQTASASPYANALPASHNLPNSLFLTATTSTNGGTGLSWWKVCTNYPTCSTFSTPPFPAIGPDVTGGPGPGGFSYHIPAQIAWSTLPVDPTYQSSYSITSTSVSGSGPYTVTLNGTFPASVNTGNVWGEFTISGASISAYNGTYQVLTSSASQITYSTAVSPGGSATGNLLWPNWRQFNETVFQADLTPIAVGFLSAYNNQPCCNLNVDDNTHGGGN